MGIISIIVIVLDMLALGLIIFGVNISQKAINIILLVSAILLAVDNSNWGRTISL